MATQENFVTASGEKVEYGTVLFGVVGNHPPAHWKFGGVRNGSVCLEHVPSGSQRAFADQFVSWDTVRRLAAAT